MYSRKLFILAVKQFIDSKVSDQQHSLSTETTTPSIRVIIMIPFKDHASVNVLKKRLTDLSSKIKTTIQPVFISRKLHFCVMRDTYVGYTLSHLHEHVDRPLVSRNAHNNKIGKIAILYRRKQKLLSSIC